MARARKTIDIKRLKELANSYLLNSADDHKDMRFGTACLLEQALHETGNYNGFGYLNRNDMKASDFGSSVGINTDIGVFAEDLSHEERFEGTDDSRRYYY